MTIVITGASGLIGRRLATCLLAHGHSLHLLSRRPAPDRPQIRCFVWDPEAALPPAAGLLDADAVIHLAGEPVAQRWSGAAMRRIRESRVFGTRRLVEGLALLDRRPRSLVAASAIGYYGSREDEILEESAEPGCGFLPEVCLAWEQEAAAAESLGIRVARIRIGMVLDPCGGALGRILPPFRLGLGGRLASGAQWVSWIHHADLAELFCYVLENALAGVFNAVAPRPATNRELTRALGRALRRPAVLPIPAAALRLLFGRMSEILLASQRAVPTAALAAGFRFRYPELAPALTDLLDKDRQVFLKS